MIKEKYSASIIIPAYNNDQELEFTLQSILKSNIDLNKIEVLVCDDGSREALVYVVKKYENKINIRYFYQSDRGFCASAARNMGILNAKGSICIFIDSGVMLSVNCITAHINAHEKKHTAVIGYVYGFDNANQNRDKILKLLDVSDVDLSIERLENAGIYDIREETYREMGDELSKWPAPWCYFWTCNVSVERVDLINCAMFDESYIEWGGEDIDMGLALSKNNCSFVLSREASAIHYPHQKRNKIYDGSELFMQSLMKRRRKLYEKYNLPEILIWNKVKDARGLNRYLIEHPEEWDNKKQR